MATLRSDVRTLVRDYMYESSADVFSDAQINRMYLQELRSLPRKGVYLEALYETTTVLNTREYALPTGTIKVEKVERNDGTDAIPEWSEIQGWQQYAGGLILPYLPGSDEDIRIHIRKAFTDITDDAISLDIPDDKVDALVWGTVIRCYKMLIGYLRQAKNWDSVSKPDYLTISQVQNWIREAESEYREILKTYLVQPLPRSMDLVS